MASDRLIEAAETALYRWQAGVGIIKGAETITSARDMRDVARRLDDLDDALWHLERNATTDEQRAAAERIHQAMMGR